MVLALDDALLLTLLVPYTVHVRIPLPTNMVTQARWAVMAYPYNPYYWGMPPYLPDPFAAMYAWSSMWMGFIAMMYYIEMYKIMLDMWRKYAEAAVKVATPATEAGQT